MNASRHQFQEQNLHQPSEARLGKPKPNLNEKNAELLKQLQETKKIVEKEIHRRLVLQLSIRAVNKTMTEEDQTLLEQLYLDLRSINPELAFATLKAAAVINNPKAKTNEANKQEKVAQEKIDNQKLLQQQQQQQQQQQKNQDNQQNQENHLQQQQLQQKQKQQHKQQQHQQFEQQHQQYKQYEQQQFQHQQLLKQQYLLQQQQQHQHHLNQLHLQNRLRQQQQVVFNNHGTRSIVVPHTRIDHHPAQSYHNQSFF